MAAQYDVNLEKCALLKCLCEARLLQDRCSVDTGGFIAASMLARHV